MRLVALFLVFIFSAALIVFGIPSYLGPDDLRECDERPTTEGICRPADAVVAISGGDTRARASEAVRLYELGWADKLVFSGAAQDIEGPSNALVMKQQAVMAGVPAEKIIIEEFARTTAENAVNTQELALRKGLKRIILVTSAYHQRRAAIEFKKNFDENIEIVNHPVESDRQWGSWWWITPAGWWLAMGELVKIAVVYVSGSY